MGFFDFFRSKKNSYDNKTSEIDLNDLDSTDTIADDGSSEFNIGLIYEEGLDRRDYFEAAEWYQKSSDKGFANAHFNLGNLYRRGQGVDIDLERAASLYNKAAQQGYAAAQYELGVMYINGTGVKQNYSEAFRLFNLAASQGYAFAQFNLGIMYYRGDGVEVDFDKASYWYEKSAQQGYAPAQLSLGNMYEYGKGVDQNYDAAIEWYKKAADQNLEGSQEILTSLLNKRDSQLTDTPSSLNEYFNDEEEDIDSIYFDLGKICEDNNDFEGAYQWYLKAANNNHSDAQLKLGLLLEESDSNRSIEWLKIAAEQNNSFAQLRLGILYKTGKGVPQSDLKAKEWYEKAAH